ncbi:MAG: HFX_2341 family transcriptional regulator domain-containing protein [Promethearchaeota archaeon]
MQIKYPQRIHVIPIGDDEVDRIVIPTKMIKADRIYLIFKKGKNLFEELVKNCKNEILSNNIVQSDDLIEIKCDIFDFTELLQIFADIIRKEKKDHNTVYFSLSTGGNLMASAGMLSCIIFGAEPYFVKKDFKKNRILPEILPFPQFKIELPNISLISFLSKIKKEMEKQKSEMISKVDCLKIMEFLHPNEKLSNTPGDYNKLKFRYLDKLEKRGYIEIEEKPRGKIQVTTEGEFALKIFSIYYGLTEYNY